jgi:hypothetical protein
MSKSLQVAQLAFFIGGVVAGRVYTARNTFRNMRTVTYNTNALYGIDAPVTLGANIPYDLKVMKAIDENVCAKRSSSMGVPSTGVQFIVERASTGLIKRYRAVCY